MKRLSNEPTRNTSSSCWSRQAYNAGNHADFIPVVWLEELIRWFPRFTGPTSENPCGWSEPCFAKRLLGSFWFACFQDKNKELQSFMFFKDTEGIVAPGSAQRETHPTLELGQGCGNYFLIVANTLLRPQCTTQENDPVFVTLIRFISSIALSPWDKFD